MEHGEGFEPPYTELQSATQPLSYPCIYLIYVGRRERNCTSVLRFWRPSDYLHYLYSPKLKRRCKSSLEVVILAGLEPALVA